MFIATGRNISRELFSQFYGHVLYAKIQHKRIHTKTNIFDKHWHQRTHIRTHLNRDKWVNYISTHSYRRYTRIGIRYSHLWIHTAGIHAHICIHTRKYMLSIRLISHKSLKDPPKKCTTNSFLHNHMVQKSILNISGFTRVSVSLLTTRCRFFVSHYHVNHLGFPGSTCNTRIWLSIRSLRSCNVSNPKYCFQKKYRILFSK